MKQLLFPLAFILFFSCEKESIENEQIKQDTSSLNSWKLVSIIQDGVNYTTECDKQNTINLEAGSQINQIFFDTNGKDCTQISSISGTLNKSSSEFTSTDDSTTGTIEINDNNLKLTYTGKLSGTIITYTQQ